MSFLRAAGPSLPVLHAAQSACDKQKKHSNQALLPVDAQQQRRQQSEVIPIRLFMSYIALDLALLTTAIPRFVTQNDRLVHTGARTFLPIRQRAYDNNFYKALTAQHQPPPPANVTTPFKPPNFGKSVAQPY